MQQVQGTCAASAVSTTRASHLNVGVGKTLVKSSCSSEVQQRHLTWGHENRKCTWGRRTRIRSMCVSGMTWTNWPYEFADQRRSWTSSDQSAWIWTQKAPSGIKWGSAHKSGRRRENWKWHAVFLILKWLFCDVLSCLGGFKGTSPLFIPKRGGRHLGRAQVLTVLQVV